MVSGANDPYRSLAPELEAALRQGGADLDVQMIAAGHELTENDLKIAAAWLR